MTGLSIAVFAGLICGILLEARLHLIGRSEARANRVYADVIAAIAAAHRRVDTLQNDVAKLKQDATR